MHEPGSVVMRTAHISTLSTAGLNLNHSLHKKEALLVSKAVDKGNVIHFLAKETANYFKSKNVKIKKTKKINRAA